MSDGQPCDAHRMDNRDLRPHRTPAGPLIGTSGNHGEVVPR